jgi:predicted flap endonuclease-1-like 5' DNA nuclease
VRGARIQSLAVIWILLAIAIAVAFAAGWAYGVRRPPASEATTLAAPVVQAQPPDAAAALTAERARLLRSYEAEAARLRAMLTDRDDAIEGAQAEMARYRQIVVDIENNAPPPLLDSPTTPDDLKMIVGVGPVLERMLYQLGITTYRQIARWTERDIADVDAKLPEFPGRIRRDAWVTQARALHQSKYGEAP